MACVGVSFNYCLVGDLGVQCLVRNHQDCFREFSDDYDGRYCEGE